MQINKPAIKAQIEICNNIIADIETGNYRNASVLIRFYLNDKSFIWYKDINSIIQDQISNLFIDIEQNFKNNYTIEFFKHILNDLTWELIHL